MESQSIKQYLADELKQDGSEQERLLAKVTKYQDIAQEFSAWLETRTFPAQGVTVEGYNASKIAEIAPMLSGIGVYNCLVDLRDHPKQMLDYLAQGLPVL